MSDSTLKKNVKEIPAGQVGPCIDSGVCKPKEGVTPRKKTLKREADTKMTKNKVTLMRNSAELLPHVLPNARGYRYVNKEAEKLLFMYIIPQKQLKALFLALLEASQSKKESLQLAMTGAALFQYLAKQKNIEVFVISMQDINYQLNKNKRPPTNSATRVLKCYHDFLDIFLKEASNTVSAHLKHNHMIKLLSKKDHSQAVMRTMSNEKLVFVKKFLENNLKKGFIEASSALCSSPIMLAVKPGVASVSA